MKTRSLIMSALLLFAIALPLRAAETLNDPTYHFTLALPDGFEPAPQFIGAKPDIIHAYAYGEPDRNGMRVLLLIERMHGTIGREHINASKLPPGSKGSIFVTRWHDFEVDAISVPEQQRGTDYLTCNVQIPLKHEAIQVELFGAASRKAELDRLLPQVLGGLNGESNWLGSAMPAGSSFASSPHYTMLLMVVTAVAVIGGLVVLWLISRRTSRGTVLGIAIAIYLCGWWIRDNRVREVVLLIGILRMLGFAGIILGIVDLLRSRKPRVSTVSSPPPLPPLPPRDDLPR
jgi:hypothetical protein